MNIIESAASALSSVMANKMRSALTMLGIIIGIGSVIMITSIGEGVQNETSGRLAQLGLDALVVSVSRGAMDIKMSDYLTPADGQTIRLAGNVEYVSPLVSSSASAKLKNPNETQRCSVYGTTNEYRYTQPMELLHGRFIIDSDAAGSSRVCVIDSQLALKAFGVEDAVGQRITLSFRYGSQTFDVVGVTRGVDYGVYYEAPSEVYLPITTAMSVLNTQYVGAFYVTVKNKALADKTAREIAALLSVSHNSKDRYSVQNLMNQAEQIGSIMGYVTTFVALVAGISLVVGGIGVMNIMLVTVTERTREIGIRKSLGATGGNIRFQFLVEAVILTVIGGVIGIILGYAGGWAVSLFVAITPVVTPFAIILTVAVSSATGIIFGVYPASRAAGLDPIEALRYE